MNAQELRTLRTYPRFFRLDGIPVRVCSRDQLPEAYAGSGNWEPFAARSRLLVHGKYVTSKRFDALCRQYDRLLEHGGPFIDSEH